MNRIAALALLCAASASAPAGATPFPVSPVERALVFSACAGRFSAAAEFSYLFPDRDAGASLHRRELFLEMLAAVMPAAQAAGLPPEMSMSVRIEAKAAQRDLLHRAAFSFDPLAAEPAEAASAQFLADCEALILGV